jgi:hypothetical protein
MPDNEAVIKEFEAAKAKYLEVLKKMAEAKIAPALRPVEATCGVGEVCHGGKF